MPIRNPGHNPDTIEATLNNSEPCDPYREEIILPLGAWRDAAGAALSGSSTPDVAAVSTNFQSLKWDHGDDDADVIVAQFHMPLNYGQDFYDFRVPVRALVVDGDLENADLTLQLAVAWFNSTDGADALAAAIELDEAVAVASSLTIGGFGRYEFNVGAALVAAGKQIKAGDLVVLRIGPTETAGTTDLDLHAIPGNPYISRHAGFYDRSLR